MNYARLIQKILEISIKQDGINYAGYGDIYSFNSETVNEYPAVWIYCPNGVVMNDNLVTANLYLVYMDRVTNRMDDNNTENLLIENAGQNILYNIIKKIKMLDEIDIEEEDFTFQIFDGVEEKSDNVHGGYVALNISFVNTNTCVVD